MILIVDDKPENIFSLKTILELHSFPTDTALSGEEALKKILRQPYALIILDVQMPGMDGFEVAEAIGGYSKARGHPDHLFYPRRILIKNLLPGDIHRAAATISQSRSTRISCC